jgi:hypothetical protein
MVSPPFKAGFSVDPGGFRFTDDGIVSYGSGGNFAGNARGTALNTYHATRSPTGWMTTALAPPDMIYDTRGGGVSGQALDLRRAMTVMSRRGVPGDKLGFYLRGLDGAFTRIGDAEGELGQRAPVGTSADLSHIVFNHGSQGFGYTDLYEYVGTGNEGPPRAVSVDNHGQQTPDPKCVNDVSGDGRVIVYTTGCNGGTSQVWARVGGTASVAVSGSECTRTAGDTDGVCKGASAANYAGGAVDGSRIFFTTSQQLVNADTNTGNDLYACDVPPGTPAPEGTANPCASLTDVSGTTSDAQVENVVTVSQDGSRVYFVAGGVLANNLGVGGVGPATLADVPEPHNLYMWERNSAHPAGATRFVTRLDGSDLTRAQMTPDGRYLLFLTGSKLVTAGPGADTDDAVDAYRYDIVTESIVRVSTSVSGTGGNGPGVGVSMAPGGSSMAADGSSVIFDTDEELSASDTNGVTDVYAWRQDGRVSLISAVGGRSVGVSPSGRDIFFTSDAPVLAADGDFNTDIYDARVDGGFAVAQTPPCSGDECQRQRSQPPSLPEPPVAVPGRPGPVKVAPTFVLRAVTAAQRRALAATGKVSLLVTGNAPGTVSVKATATIGGRSVAVGSVRRAMAAPGRLTVSLALSRTARRQLAARGRLTVKVSAHHSKVALDRSVTLRLARAKRKATNAKSRASAHRFVVGTGRGQS